MVEAVSELYGHIFLYLSSVMDWMMEKKRTRFIGSFNENLVERFENDIKRISTNAERIRNLASQSSRAEARFHRLETESVNRDIRLGLHGLARETAEMRYEMEAMRRRQVKIEEDRQQEPLYQKQLGYNVNLFLEERSRHARAIQYSVKIMSSGQLDVLAQSGLHLGSLDHGMAPFQAPSVVMESPLTNSNT